MCATVLLFALYLIFGFFALPAIVKWQIEKQVPEKLGHPISVGEVRCNPLLLTFEVGDLVLSNTEGSPILSFKRLQIDFAMRSVVDQAWTFSLASLEAPVARLNFDKEGRHSFSALLERLIADEPESQDSPLPRFVVSRLSLSDGRLEISDEFLDEPLVAHIEPLSVDISNLSSLHAQPAHYRLSVRTRLGETLDASGELTLDPFASNGEVALGNLKAVTLAASLSRLFRLDSLAGNISAAASYDLALDQNGAIAGTVHDVALEIAEFSLSAPGVPSPLLAFEAFALKQGRVDLAAHQISLASVSLTKGRVAAVQDDHGNVDWVRLVLPASAAAAFEPPPTNAVSESAHKEANATATTLAKPWRISATDAEVSEMALSFSDAANKLKVQLASVSLDTAPSAEFGPAGLSFVLNHPRLTISGAQLKSGSDSLGVSEVVIEAGQTRFVAADTQLKLGIDEPHSTLSAVQLQLGGDTMEIGRSEIASDTLSLTQDGGDTRIEATVVRTALSNFQAQRNTNRINVRDASFATRSISFANGVDARFDDVTLKLKSADVAALDPPAGTGGASAADFGAKSLRIAFADGPLDVTGDGLSASLSDAVMRSPDDASEMLRLSSVALSGGVFKLEDRLMTAESLVLANGKTRIGLDAQGNFAGLNVSRKALEMADPDAQPDTARTTAQSRQEQARAWRLALKSAKAADIAVGFEDHRLTPPMTLGLNVLRGEAKDFSTSSASPMSLDIKARLDSGGDIAASGNVHADGGTSDLKISLAGVELVPAQAYLSEFAKLKLVSGTLSGSGRLRYNNPTGSRLAYEGSVALDRLLLEEIQPKRTFLSWDSVASDDIVLTLEPNRLDIGELRVDRPSGRLIIAADQSVNLMDVLRQPNKNDATEEQKAIQVSGDKAPADEQQDDIQAQIVERDLFPFTIAFVRVSGGTLEFADQSLRPQFGTRMHELKGVITGIGSDPNHGAKVQLDARVDKYGSAKIRGQISILKPERFTEIDMTFRDLEMTSLSPYVAKFAGYSIASGRLAMDLQYRVKSGHLQGENKIVLKQVELGEKVESPQALDLPLELALAILKDSRGVIDVELPVSGDLNDPQFDYGAVIGKAIGNLLDSVILAPFKALGALFGSGDEKLDSIDFEPGSADIAPPERQKLGTVARALKARPSLTLIVPPTYAANMDTVALKSRAVRSEIVQRMGIELIRGEDPGPIDTSNPRVQHAIEEMFIQHYAPEVLSTLKRKALQSETMIGDPYVPAGESGPRDATQTGKPMSDPLPAFYQGLVDRLITEEAVSEEMLLQLAARRSDAIIAELVLTGGIPAARIVPGPLDKSAQANTMNESNGVNERAVTLRLQLEVSK